MKRAERRKAQRVFMSDLRRTSHAWRYLDKAQVHALLAEQIRAGSIHLVFRARFCGEETPRWLTALLATRHGDSWTGLVLIPDTDRLRARHGELGGMAEIDPRDAEVFSKTFEHKEVVPRCAQVTDGVFQMLLTRPPGVTSPLDARTDTIPEVGTPKVRLAGSAS